MHFLSKVVVFNIQTTFFDGNTVFFRFGRNTLENAYKITSKSKFSTQNVQIPYHLHPALSYSLMMSFLQRQIRFHVIYILSERNHVFDASLSKFGFVLVSLIICNHWVQAPNFPLIFLREEKA